jgi:hypothetical protein
MSPTVAPAGRIAVVGLGDLGRRIAAQLARVEGLQIVVAGRGASGSATAALLSLCGAAAVRFRPLDALDPGSLERFLIEERPDLVVQCASRLSPWYLEGRTDPASCALRAAGFAVQLPAQLPAIAALMLAARNVGFSGAVVNCSYPDATHPLLATAGLQPTLGIGNVAMIQARVEAALRARGHDHGRGDQPLVRVAAHHAQVRAAMAAEAPPPADRPWVFLGERPERVDDLAHAGQPLPITRELNALSAVSAGALALALLPGASTVRSSAPGPLGLPGGWPIRVVGGRVALDLPAGVTVDALVAQQWRWARGDGLAGMDGQGRVVFTEQARHALAAVDPALTEPLGLSDAPSRWQRLARHLGLPAG